MRNRLVKYICSLLAVISVCPLFSLLSFSAAAEAKPEAVSDQALCCHVESGKILYEKNAAGRIAPASFVKLMTAILAFEYYERAGNVSVTVTEEMLSSSGGTTMSLKAGETLPFSSLLAGLTVRGANDAALVIASEVGGSVTAFVEQMNERAAALGMEHSYFANPTGVDHAMQYSSLEDITKLCLAAYRVNAFTVMASLPEVNIPATNMTAERVYTNKNALVPFSYVTDYYMENANGLTAGYTAASGWSCATVHKSGGETFLVVVSGGKDLSEAQNQRDITAYRDAKRLIEWAETNYAMRCVVPADFIVEERGVRLASGVDHVVLVTKNEFSALLEAEADLSVRIRKEILLQEGVYTAPIMQGQQFGTMEIYFDEEWIGSVPLVAQANVGLSGWLVMWDAVESFFSQGPAKAVLILAIVAAVGYVLVLIGTVWLQWQRKNRSRQRAINEMLATEKRRMQKVRLAERRDRQARMRRARTFLREGFSVLSGETEIIGTKAVAKVPEKYRKASRSAAGQPRGSSPQKPTRPSSQNKGSDRPTNTTKSPRAKRPSPPPSRGKRPPTAPNKQPPRPKQK